jgi:hypothetical protein
MESARGGREPFSERGAFILAKLRAHDAVNLKDVLADVCREGLPDPTDMTLSAAADAARLAARTTDWRDPGDVDHIPGGSEVRRPRK